MSQRIVIVDNEPDFRLMLTEIVQALGYEAEAVDRASEAWRSISRDPASLILLDIKMPVMSGDDFLKFLRGQGKDVPVIAISGYLTPQVMENLVHYRVQKVIRKPFTVQRLARDISEVLDDSKEAVEG